MPRDRYDDDRDDDRPRRRRYDEDEDEDDRPRRRRRDDDDFDRRTKKGGGKGLFVILGVIGGVFLLLVVGGVIVAIPLFQKAREARERKQTSDRYKMVGLAAHNYESAYGQFPAPFVRRPTEPQWQPKPPTDLPDRLAWRVNLLPYIEYDYAFRQFDLNQPWNSPRNQPLAANVVMPYADVETPADPNTRVRCFYDNGAAFESGGQVSMTGITDGTSNTILFVEGGDKVTWTRFQEYRFDPNGPLPTLGKPGAPGFTAVFADGSVRYIRHTVNPAALKAAITRAGGEVSFLDD